jgi:hypothetical protein
LQDALSRLLSPSRKPTRISLPHVSQEDNLFHYVQKALINTLAEVLSFLELTPSLWRNHPEGWFEYFEGTGRSVLVIAETPEKKILQLDC